MAKELKGIHSLIGQALAPDFSKEDPGDALYCHMQNISALLRAAQLMSDPNYEGDLHDTCELLRLFEDCFEKGLEEFDVRSSMAEKKAVATIGARRGKVA